MIMYYIGLVLTFITMVLIYISDGSATAEVFFSAMFIFNYLEIQRKTGDQGEV